MTILIVAILNRFLWNNIWEEILRFDFGGNEVKNIWEILGIEPTKDIALIKRAFSERSKEVHPEEHPEEFMELRRAYRAACDYAVTEKEEFFISAKEIELSKKPIIEEEERANIFATLKLMSQEESFLAENREDSIFTEIEKLLEEMQKDIEFLIIEFKRIMIDSPSSNKIFKEYFNSEKYIRYCQSRDFVEIFTDVLCYYTRKLEFNKTLMKEINRLHKKYGHDIYIDSTFSYVKYEQAKIPKGTILEYLRANSFAILMFLSISLFAGWNGFLTMLGLIAIPMGLVILFMLAMKFFFKE